MSAARKRSLELQKTPRKYRALSSAGVFPFERAQSPLWPKKVRRRDYKWIKRELKRELKFALRNEVSLRQTMAAVRNSEAAITNYCISAFVPVNNCLGGVTALRDLLFSFCYVEAEDYLLHLRRREMDAVSDDCNPTGYSKSLSCTLRENSRRTQKRLQETELWSLLKHKRYAFRKLSAEHFYEFPLAQAPYFCEGCCKRSAKQTGLKRCGGDDFDFDYCEKMYCDECYGEWMERSWNGECDLVCANSECLQTYAKWHPS